ncbi:MULTISPECIES: methyltransferase, TIGR04325 family [Stenotrophomonas]|uniref:methyltransferase, TIGR04325 family n=1 Tax=Stenotrophomonas TaxID=40323 RepID=UPI001CF5FB1B|nr:MULTISPECIES: methyltransferase, TIGR04325 family [Stenotrophomonas]MCA7023042.1 methyltransferase, TIGR04325 family [Stenotrophomonas acidaminiphila]MCE4075386.1 methyltransferase, TIGR04325 family [Stenotrophomonas acidaminiphila]
MSNKFVHLWLPPVLRTAVNRLMGARIIYRGEFASWSEACGSSSGYDHGAILRRISDATQRVLRGEARYEQDGITFRGEPPASHALSGLMLAAGRRSGHLSVLDFGGGLGSHYLRWRPLLECLPSLRWAIVEQPCFAAEGSRLFASEPSVSFHESVAQVESRPSAILASSVLQYLPNPHVVLHELVALGAEIIVLDRMPYGDREVIATQFVPVNMGGASYPIRILSRKAIHGLLGGAYGLVAEFDAPDQPFRISGVSATYHGSIWLRRT